MFAAYLKITQKALTDVYSDKAIKMTVPLDRPMALGTFDGKDCKIKPSVADAIITLAESSIVFLDATIVVNDDRVDLQVVTTRSEQ